MRKGARFFVGFEGGLPRLLYASTFWFKEFLDHRDPRHLLGPPLRRDDPQSYSALSDYLLTYSYSKRRHYLF